jgi:5,10-methylenetetrahydromethanopterin reductase
VGEVRLRFGAALWGPFPLRRYVELATAAERSGFDSFWIGDTQLLTPDLYSALALCAGATSRILLGSGVTNTVTRDLTVTAGGFLALNEFSHGRSLLGIGVGGSAVATVGLREDPAREFRAKLESIVRLVRGEAVALRGVQARGKIPAPPVPVYVASSSPTGLRIAGELADGVILNVGVAPELVAEALQHVDQGLRAAGRDRRSLDVAVFAGSSIRADCGLALDETRSWAATTARRIGQWMAAGGDQMRSLGATILQQYRWDDHIAVGAAHAKPVSDEMARHFVLAGTPDDVAGAIERLEPLGVNHVIGLLMGADLDGTVAAYARDIIPARRTAPATRTSA